MDILAIIGGLNASIGPILGLFMPLFMLAYLFQLAELIRTKHIDNYHDFIYVMHHDYKNIFKKIKMENCVCLSIEE